MNAQDLKPGFYRITTEVLKHPGIDKRVNSDWRKMPLKPGMRLICRESQERDKSDSSFASRIELCPYSGCAGQQFDTLYRVLVAWRMADGKLVKRDADGDNAVADELLKVLEPSPVEDVDDALALFNVDAYPEIDWRDVAIYLLSREVRATAAVLRDTSRELGLLDEVAGEDKYTEVRNGLARKALRL